MAAKTRAPWTVRYLRQPRLGLAASRNVALQQATMSIVAVTDDDCVPDRDWVANIERVLASPSAPDAVTGRVLPLGDDGFPPHASSSAASVVTDIT